MWPIWILHIEKKIKKEVSDQTVTSERDIMAAYLLYLVRRQSKIKLPQQRISVRTVTLAVAPPTLQEFSPFLTLDK